MKNHQRVISYHLRYFGMVWLFYAVCAAAAFPLFRAVPTADQQAYGDDDMPSSEIFNGRVATRNSWPWMAHLQRYGSYICGGTLVKKKWVVTAAHCVIKPGTYTVILGDHHRTLEDGTEQTFSVTEKIIHPDYDSSTNENDIAVLKLSSSADISGSAVATVPRLATNGNDNVILKPESECFITGWGYEHDSNDIWRLAIRLQELQLTILNNSRCTDVMLGFNNPATNICYEAPFAGSCKGDDGSPVVCRIKDRWTLVGVQSFGLLLDGCRGGPKIGTRVSQFVRWINVNTCK